MNESLGSNPAFDLLVSLRALSSDLLLGRLRHIVLLPFEELDHFDHVLHAIRSQRKCFVACVRRSHLHEALGVGVARSEQGLLTHDLIEVGGVAEHFLRFTQFNARVRVRNESGDDMLAEMPDEDLS